MIGLQQPKKPFIDQIIRYEDIISNLQTKIDIHYKKDGSIAITGDFDGDGDTDLVKNENRDLILYRNEGEKGLTRVGPISGGSTKEQPGYKKGDSGGPRGASTTG